MTLDSAIFPLLSGIAAMAARDGQGRRPLVAGSAADRLRAIIDLIAHTVLPRSYVLYAGSATAATLTVASGRLLKLSLPSSAPVTGPEAESRDAVRAHVVRALAGIAHAAGGLAVGTNYIAEDLAAEDVGQTATELREFSEAHGWFAELPVGGDRFADRATALTISHVALDADGTVTDRTGDTGYADGEDAFAALLTETNGWQSNLEALAGLPAMIVLRGSPSQMALTVALTPDSTLISVCDDANVASLIGHWARSLADEDQAG